MDFAPLPQQRRAIEAAPGPVLVVAGPGAGKTFCLIARITHLVDTLGVAPERICAVTFTNRAAEEIALRLKHTLRDRADAITRGTIHALCLALLRDHAEAAGLRRGVGVAGEQYQKVILGRLPGPLEQRGALLNRFSRHRVQDYRLTLEDARLYREYAVWLAHRNMLDFDDLVAKGEQLLRTRSDIGEAIRARLGGGGSLRPGVVRPGLRDRATDHPGQEPPLLTPDLRNGAACARAESAAVREAAQRRPGIAVRGRRVGVPRRSGRSRLAARGPPERPRRVGPELGRLRGPIPQAQARRVPRGAAAASGDSLPAGAGPLAGRGRRHQVRDRGAADRARPGRSGGDRGVRALRALAALSARGRGRDLGLTPCRRRLAGWNPRARPAPARADSRHQEAGAAGLSGGEPPRPAPLTPRAGAAGR